MTQCWICGALADSGEHMIKKSDLQRVMTGKVDQKSPIYHRASGEKKRPIGSLKSEALKFNKSICTICNGALSQPHDYAWDLLSGYLASSSIVAGQEVELSNVFNGNINQSIKNVHLFFCKIFGCAAVESSLNLDLNEIANCIKTNTVHPNLYLKVRCNDNGKSASYCALSDIEVFRLTDGSIKYVHLFYTVGNYSVNILYSEDIEGLDLKGYFKPDNSTMKLKIGSADYNQDYQTHKTS